MGRLTRVIGYGLAGFVLAISLSVAAFAVAGGSLSDSEQGVSVNGAPDVTTPSAKTPWKPTWSPPSAPTREHKHRDGGRRTNTSTPASTPTTSTTPAPSTNDNGGSGDNSGSGSGDGGGQGSGDNHDDD